ncbi:hypothetical protein A9K55_000172 [Cordyceps militaris]|uniref:SWIM-type domain-containing protein n=1 Tax=Cordyceps militaris TaxID=73501 RepID=A0A2H4SWI6_CORMI|nr:hypothetical protein A9K55_000172 [Cordyceps militaris]
MPDILPSQRELISKLVHALCETYHNDLSSAAAVTTKKTERHASPAAAPWDSPQRRKLILTLHVVFPGMLLPALDLLDRNLVRRLTLDTTTPASAGRQEDTACPSPSQGGQETPGGAWRPAVYTVRSAPYTLARRGAAAAVTRAYLVHLEAWSCSCVAFTVDAYADGARPGPAEAADDEAAPLRGRFGGVSTAQWDTHGAEATPCCKHLLACLLVHEWEELLAAHVENKRCTREELAGIIAGI